MFDRHDSALLLNDVQESDGLPVSLKHIQRGICLIMMMAAAATQKHASTSRLGFTQV